MIDPDVAEALEASCLARALDVEGIPMVLALEDLTGGEPGPAGPGAAVAGARQADLVEGYRAVLRPDAADGDLDALHDVIAVVSAAHGPLR